MPACLNIKAPDNVSVFGGRRQKPVDASQVPKTNSHEEAKRVLEKAYAEIRHLNRKVEKLEESKRKAKDERDEWKRKYKRLEDRYDD
ncbi:MAG: hypothetical protein O7F76_02975 [Planctomycetota bacterium]|nr:hypothetical protein [Planctomycetota bacterium]